MPRPEHLPLLQLLVAAALLLPLGAAHSGELELQVVPAEQLPIRAATVFSDRALVVRRGEAKLPKGRVRLALPALPATTDPGSIRLASQGATVLRVEVRREDVGELADSAAVALVARLDKLQDARAALQDRLTTLAQERSLLLSLRPVAPPLQDPKGPPALLDATGWRASLAFLDERTAALDRDAKPLQAKLRETVQELAAATAEAQQLAAGATSVPGFRVEALVLGEGKAATVELRYLAAGARWYPAYDLRFSPGAAEVEVQFAGLVSQETGEDWVDAQLTLSTAVPATTAALPRLASWKIGEKERFVPTPEEKPRERPPVEAPTPAFTTEGKEGGKRLRELINRPEYEEDDDVGELDKKKVVVSKNNVRIRLEELAIDGELEAQKGERGPAKVGIGRHRVTMDERSRAPADAPASPAAAEAYETTTALPSAPAPGNPFSGLFSSDEESDGRPESLQLVPLRGQPGWVAPSYSSDLPAALAGGYDFSYPAARPESVRSGGEARRVALHGARFPAQPNVTILPALRKQAFVVAEVVNRSDRPLLAGLANLFVGSDLQGQALLTTTAVGETASLPLGIDEAIQVERAIHPTTAEKGLFFKDDVTTYEVVIELSNPRKNGVKARVIDQLPLAVGEKLEVKLESMSPVASVDKTEGLLTWKLDLPAGSKKVITFRYSLTRPRGAKLRQQ